MCLITSQSEPTILTKDMVVYKVFKETDKLTSLFETFTWELNRLYRTLIGPGNVSFLDLVAQTRTIESISPHLKRNFTWYLYSDRDAAALYKYGLCSYGPGFHSMKTLKRAHAFMNNRLHCKENAVIYKCVIPAGSQLYQDLSGLVVSNQIIVLNKF